MARRPWGARTRRISPSADSLSDTNCRPSELSTTSNDPSASGNDSALASCHSIGAPDEETERATANIAGLISSPPTAPSGPTRSAASRVEQRRGEGRSDRRDEVPFVVLSRVPAILLERDRRRRCAHFFLLWSVL